MSAISIGISPVTAYLPNSVALLIISGLVGGVAQPGDTLQANLSDGSSILTYAWGRTPGGTDYGTSATLTVPEAAAGSLLHLAVTTASAGTFTVMVNVAAAAQQTVINPASDAIEIQSLAALPSLPPLSVLAGTDIINVEIF